MSKFQRNYKLEVMGGDGMIHIFTYPLTLQFHISRAALASANNASLRLYNLNQDTRRSIYKDYFNNIDGSFKSVKLYAGYGDNLTLILSGHIKEASSYKEEGAVDFTTHIDVYDWSFAMANSLSAWTSVSPAPKQEVINRLVNDLVVNSPSSSNLGVGYISFFPGDYGRPYTADGNTWDKLKEATNDHCFIDNGLIHCLLDDDIFVGDTTLIDASTGLLSSPKKSESLLKIDILFEPTLQVGQKIGLRSSTESLYNDEYKIIGIEHSGIISGSVGGKCKTSLILNSGKFTLVNGEVTRTPVALGV